MDRRTESTQTNREDLKMNVTFYGKSGSNVFGDYIDYVIRTEMDGFTICDDFNGRTHKRTRIIQPLDENLGAGRHLYVKQNSEYSSFPVWLRGHGHKED